VLGHSWTGSTVPLSFHLAFISVHLRLKCIVPALGGQGAAGGVRCQPSSGQKASFGYRPVGDCINLRAKFMLLARFYLAWWLLALLPGTAGAGYVPALFTPPAPLREFRGAWLSTVAAEPWPSKPGLPVAQQKAELVALLNQAARLRLNAVIFQVRPSADAFYASTLEPWSEFLMGRMGQAPQPFYDPLALAINEAHQRGMELHAWFNPFRAIHANAKSPAAPNHFSRTHPELVRRYDDELWLDPGEPAVREHVLKVVLDVVNRYDVDGVQFDDYFYPSPVKDARGRELDFPDQATWAKYGHGLDRATWRRQNINQLVQSVYAGIKAVKPWVQFGISPRGIWRPNYPAQIRGFDAYANIYADSRLWLANGWVDYLSPQLYWPVAKPEQSFPALLGWWASQNFHGRHLWPGLADYETGGRFAPDEIARQIDVTRQLPDRGAIHFHLRNLAENRGLNESVRIKYTEGALVPASPWLDAVPPEKPRMMVTPQPWGVLAFWDTGGGKPVRNWVLQSRTNGVWHTEILPAWRTQWRFNNPGPEAVAVSAADRLGNLSKPAGMVRR